MCLCKMNTLRMEVDIFHRALTDIWQDSLTGRHGDKPQQPLPDIPQRYPASVSVSTVEFMGSHCDVYW